MNATPLKLVDPATGEVHDDCPTCQHMKDVIAGLQRDIRGWAAREQQLKRDIAKDAREHPLWAELHAKFDLWRAECDHPRSKFTPARFFLALPFYEQYGADKIDQAIAGAKFDPWKKRRKNGSVKRFDTWEWIFESAGNFEEFCNKAPRMAAA